jgi:hypothetical protein
MNAYKTDDTVTFRVGFKHFDSASDASPSAVSIGRYDYVFTLVEEANA